MKAKKLLTRLCLGLVAILVTLGLPEMACRTRYEINDRLSLLVPSQRSDGYWFLPSDRAPFVRPKGTEKTTFPVKTPRIVRIMTVGGSTTHGAPGSPELGFPHFVLEILQQRFPEATVEVYNLGFFAQTMAFAAEVTEEARSLRPDVIVVYSGHNELYPHNLFWAAQTAAPLPRMIQGFHFSLRKRSVAFAAMAERFKRERKLEQDDLASFRWQDHLETAERTYRTNLERIGEVAEASGATQVIMMPARNLMDFPPSGEFDYSVRHHFSLQESAGDMSPDDAFRYGHWLLEQSEPGLARQAFEQASDRTVYVGRIHSRLLSILREYASANENVILIDTEAQLESSAGGRPLGDEEFVDWCHLRLPTRYHVARMLVSALEDEIGTRTAMKATGHIPSYNEALFAILGGNDSLLNMYFEESGFINVQFGRSRQAAEFFRQRLESGYSLKSSLGIGLALLRLNDKDGATTVARQILAASTTTEISTAIDTFYSFNRAGIEELLGLAESAAPTPGGKALMTQSPKFRPTK